MFHVLLSLCFCFLASHNLFAFPLFTLRPFPALPKDQSLRGRWRNIPHMYMSYSDLFLVPNPRKHIDCYELYVTPNWAHNIKGTPCGAPFIPLSSSV